MSEVWMSIPGFDGYEASSLGRVRSWIKKGRKTTQKYLSQPIVMAHHVHGVSGYATVSLIAPGRRKGLTRTVHSLVCETFHGPRPDGCVVRHFPDNDRLNCRADNLSWGSPTENQRDRIFHGTKMFGAHHPNATLIEGNVRVVLMLLSEKVDTGAGIGRAMGMNMPTVSRIKTGAAWSHLATAR